MTHINLISNISNGVGLQRDFELLRDVLSELGHDVRGVQFNAGTGIAQADINIFLEVVVPGLFQYAPVQMLMPNPEWFQSGWTQYFPQFKYLLCKTQNCFDIFAPLSGDTKCILTGFFSRDLFMPEVPKERRFLHIAGKSQTKNTQAILDAWKCFRIPYPLTVLSEHYRGQIPGVTFLSRASETELRILMNTHLFHLMPSMYEGFGHIIHEAFGTGSVIVTTNRAPMNEWCCDMELAVEPNTSRMHGMAQIWIVQCDEIRKSVERVWTLPQDRIEQASRCCREYFENERPKFIKAIQGVL